MITRRSQLVKRTYKKGKLFGKLSGTFIFRPKPKSNASQLPLNFKKMTGDK